jgi:class 3 adenylate cyclase
VFATWAEDAPSLEAYLGDARWYLDTVFNRRDGGMQALCPDPVERAVKMREAAGKLIATWRRRGRLLGFGAGIAQGYATLGQIGFAARLCAEAKDGQILIGQRVAVAVEETITLEEVGAVILKGLTQPVVAFNVLVTLGGS